MKPTLRAVRRGELTQVYELLNLVFATKEGSPVRFAAQMEQDSTFRLWHGRVAVVDGRVVGYVRIFARTMLIAGVPVPVGGIGAVATHPDARSQGTATALLEDAIAEMRRAQIAASFLFTGIPGFYERVGYRIVREPQFTSDAEDAAGLPHAGLWEVRPLSDADVPRLLPVYRRAIAGSTGGIVRTARTWRDTQAWLDEDAGGCLVAERNGAVAGYIRSRCRSYGHAVLEAECRPGHEGAIVALLAAVGARGVAHGERIITLAPDAHPLATALRSLPSTVETTEVEHPMMALALDSRGAPLLSGAMRWWNTDRI